LFQKLLDIISGFLSVNPLAGKEELLAQLNPNKIYVENIRSLLGVSSKAAQAICETAVRQGLFSRKIEVMCPDGSVAETADSEDRLSEFVPCRIEEDGQPDEVPTPTASLRKAVFYQLNEQRTPARPYTQSAQSV
jgi:hypothetical protein